MTSLLQDVRFAVRMLSRQPGFTAVALATLAIGIGANVAVFSLVRAMLLRDLPFRDPERLVYLYGTHPGRGIDRDVTSVPNFRDWRTRSTSFEQVTALTRPSYNLTGPEGEPVALGVGQVSANFFALLGVAPVQGRAFETGEDEPGAAPVAILGHALWQRRFGGKPVLGGTIILNDVPHTVVGIMPTGFEFPQGAQAWVPALFPERFRESRGMLFLPVMARLKDGISLEEARRDLATLAAQLEREHPRTNRGWSATAEPAHQVLAGDYRMALLVLQGAVGLVLLITCANVANLLLARAATRRSEMTLRTVLGAGRVRLVRQVLTEGLVLSSLGAAAGLVLAHWTLDVLLAAAPQLPPWVHVHLDSGVLAATAATALAAALLFGMVPALHAWRHARARGAYAGTRLVGDSESRVQGLLVSAQVALALVLLTAAGLMLRSLQHLQAAPLGFQPRGVLTVDIALPHSRYPEPRQQVAFFEALRERISSHPQVEAVSGVRDLPLSGDYGDTNITLDDRPAPAPGKREVSGIDAVLPGYFEALGLAFSAAGSRDLDERDVQGAPRVAVVNRAFAERHWPDGSAIGKTFRAGRVRMEIVGVVENLRRFNLGAVERPHFYYPYAQRPVRDMSLVLRSAGNPADLAPVVRDVVRDLDPALPLGRVKPLSRYVAGALALPRFSVQLLGLFAAIALGLGAIGLYGVLSYSVALRTSEIGVRMALGARAEDVLASIAGRGLKWTALGLAAGLVGALGLGRLLDGLLYEVRPGDPATLAVVAVLLMGVALAATAVPARRAARVDPAAALRDQ